MKRASLEEQARELRAGGLTLSAIAANLEVTERTLRRWLGRQPRGEAPAAGGDAPATPSRPDWPAEWTAEALASRGVWPLELAKSNLAVVEMARDRRNGHIVAFFKNLVEVALEFGPLAQEPGGAAGPWLFAVAGWPTLGSWAGCPHAGELADLVRHHRPWEGRRERRAYGAQAAGLADAVKERLLVVGAGMVLDSAPGLASGMAAPVLLREIGARIPMADNPPWLSPFRSKSLGTLLLTLLAFRSPAEIGGIP